MGEIFIAFLLLILGVIGIISPKTAWELTGGWRFRDAEPSDAALTYLRIAGVVEIIAAFYILFTM